MKRLLLRLYPRAWRERYGEEVLDLLASSRRPVRDSADVAARALSVRAGDAATRLRRHRWPAVLLVVIGIQGLLWSVPHLQHGIVEVPSHWWSSLSTFPLVAGLAMLALSFAPSGWRRSGTG